MKKMFIIALEIFVSTYLGDALVNSQIFEVYLQHFISVLKKLRAEKLYVELTKCNFAVSKVEFL